MKSLGDPKILNELCERLLRVEAGDLPLWGSMSACRMMRHLRLAYDMALDSGEVETIVPAPWLVKFFALKTDFRWPRNVRTTPGLKRAVEQMEPDACFAEDVAATLARMEKLAASAQCAPAHAMFGPMQTADWLRWGYLHTDHHLRQFGR